MSFWGKLAGVAAGFALGGPLGALLGGLAGHAADRQFSATPENMMRQKQLAFTVGVIALGAKMAKADGQVTRDEVQAFKEVFRFSANDMKEVGRLFDLAKQDTAGYQAYAKQLHVLFHQNEQRLLEDILDGLFHIAVADNVLHPGEISFLEDVAAIFGFSQDEFTCIAARHPLEDETNPYEILGVSPSASMEEINRRYKELLKENHPDMMAARGVPEEALEMANRNTAIINTAFDEIKRMREPA